MGSFALLTVALALWRGHSTSRHFVSDAPVVSAPVAAAAPAVAPPKTIPAASEARPATGSAVTEPKPSAIADFNAWAARFAEAAPAARAAMLAEGQALAQARREEMFQLIQSNPQQALAQALPYSLRQALPESIAGQIEQPVNARGSVTVTHFDPPLVRAGDASAKQFAVTIEKQKFEAFTYGPRLNQPSHSGIPVNGIAVANPAGRSVLALNGDAGRVLADDEARAVVASGAVPSFGKPAAKSAAVLQFGPEYRSFPSDSIARMFVKNLNSAFGRVWASGASEGGSTPKADAPFFFGGSQGILRLLYMPVLFADDPVPPQSQDGAQGTAASNNRYYVEGSYGTTHWQTTVTPPLRLPEKKNFYAEAESGSVAGSMMGAALAVAAAQGYFAGDYGYHYVLHNSIPEFKFGGISSGFLNGSPGALSHELGHNVGLGHANFWDVRGVNPAPGNLNGVSSQPTLDSDSWLGHDDVNAPPAPLNSKGETPSMVEYGDQFDVMGSGGGHFNVISKHQVLSWLPDQFIRNVVVNATNRVYAFDTPHITDGRLYGLRIYKDSDKEYYLSVRQGFPNNPWMNSGVEVMWSSLSIGQLLIDTTPGTSPGKQDCAVVVGRTFSDSFADIHITPVDRVSNGNPSDEYVDVVVNRGPFPTNLPPSMSLTASALQVGLNEPVLFSVTSSDPNGDTLAYNWDFGDLSFGTNGPVMVKSWDNDGQYVVRCEVSDMKGGVASAYVVVVVGSPTTFTMSGRVVDILGNPLQGVRVHNGGSPPAYVAPEGEGADPTPPPETPFTYRYSFTDSQGYYTIGNIPPGTYTNRAFLFGYRIDHDFNDPVVLNSSDANGLNHTAWPLPRVRIDRERDVPEVMSNIVVGINIVTNEDGSVVTNEVTAPTVGRFKITRDGDLSQDLVVFLKAPTGTAVMGTDYEAIPLTAYTFYWLTNIDNKLRTNSATFNNYTVTIGAGQNSTNLDIASIDNAIGDGDKSVTVTLQLAPFDWRIVTYLTNTLVTNHVTSNITVVVTNTEYVSVTNRYPIPGWELKPAAPDNGTLIWYQTDPTYVLSKPEDTLWILDDDPPALPQVGVLALDYEAVETRSDTATVAFYRMGAPMTNDLTVHYSVSGTAIDGEDFDHLPGTVTIPAGQQYALVPVRAVNDLFVEGPEALTITIDDDPAYAGAGNSDTVWIVDDDLPVLTIYASDSVAAKTGGNTATVLVSRAGDLTEPLTVNYLVSGTAVSGVDYQALPQTIIIPADTISANIRIVPINSASTGAKTVTITLSDTPSYNIDPQNKATITIQDNLPTVTLNVKTGSAGEGGSAGAFTINRTTNYNFNASLVVYYQVGGSAFEGSDYSPLGTNITIPAGVASVDLPVNASGANDDKYKEANAVSGPDTVILQLLPGPAYNLGGNISGTVSISDNDGGDLPAVGFMLKTSTVREDAGQVTLTLKCTTNPETNKPITLEYRVVGGSALPNVNYVPFSPVTGILHFIHYKQPDPPPKFYNPEDNIQLITIPILNDGLAAGDKTFTVRLFNPSGYETNITLIQTNGTTLTNSVIIKIPTNAYLGDSITHTVTILDVGVNRVSVSADSVVAYEAGLVPAHFIFTREGPVNAPLTVYYAITGSAAAGSDYVALTLDGRIGAVTIPAGTNSVALTVQPVDNPVEEGPEYVTLTILPRPGYMVGDATDYIYIISDDGTLQFSRSEYQAYENTGLALFSVLRSGDTNRAAAVEYVIRDGTATNSLDYLGTNGSLVFAPGETVKTVSVALLNDNVVEPDETFFIELTNATGGVPLGGQRRATFTILNDDAAILFPTNNYTVNENGTNALVLLRRIGLTNEAVSAAFATFDSSATNALDYTTVAARAEFAPGETNATMSVPIIDDALLEGNETVRLVLSDPSTNVFLGSRTNATLTILDDECLLTFSATNYVVWEYAPYAAVTVQRVGGVVNPVSVDFFTYDGTASNGVDYVATNGTAHLTGNEFVVSTNGGGQLEFRPGQSNLTLYLPLLDDMVGEGSEFFSVALSNPQTLADAMPNAARLGAVSNANVTVLDNEMAGNVDYEFANPNLALPGANGPVYALALQPDGQVVLGGDFTRVDGTVFTRLARMQSVGVADPSFNPGFGANGVVRAVAITPDSKVVVGGAFTRMDTSNWVGIARLRANGDLDASFNPGAGVTNGTVFAVAVQSDKKILLGGDFLVVNGQTRSRLARLNLDGSVDTNFTVTVGGAVSALLVQPDNRILVGGAFTTIGGAPRYYVARLTTNGVLDPTFLGNANLDGAVSALAVQADGRILVGGAFGNAGGSNYNHLVRLNTDGTVDTTFRPGLAADGVVNAIGVDGRGQITIGGGFTHYDGVVRNHFARLRSSGSLDTLFSIGSGANDLVRAVVVQPDTASLIGGDFTIVNSLPRGGIARIHGDERMNISGVEFSQGIYNVAEDAGFARITVLRSGNTNSSFSLEFATASGTATNGLNYLSTNGTMTFLPGETARTFDVVIVDNHAPDGDLTVNLQLSNVPANVDTSGRLSAVLVIEENLAALRFSLTNFGASSTSTSAVVNVVREGSFTRSISALLTTADGTAFAPYDYASVTNRLVFAPGESNKTVFIPLGLDIAGANTMFFRVALSDSQGCLLIAPSNATVTIVNNAGTLAFASGSFSNIQGSDAVVTVIRTNGLNGRVTADLSTLPGTAQPGVSYLATNLTVVLADGQASAVVRIPTYFNPAADGAMFFSVVLSNPDGGAEIGTPGTATVQMGYPATGPGAVDRAFQTGIGASGLVRAVALQNDAGVVKFLVGGAFTSINGVPHNYLARLNPDGSVDDSFLPPFANLSTNYVPVYDPTNQSFVITNIPVITTNSLVGVGANAMVSSLAVMPNGRIAAGGVFTLVNSTPSNNTNRNHVAMLTTNGLVDSFFVPPASVNAAAYTLLPQGSRLFFGGGFAAPVSGFGRLRADGGVDVTFDPGTGANGNVFCVATQADGRVLVGGSFTAFAGVAQGQLARLSSVGAVDSGFAPVVAGGSVFTLAVQPDGLILLGGDFTSVNGTPCAYLARLDAQGALDTNFCQTVGADGPVYTLALDAQGRIVVGGDFTSFPGGDRQRVARLLSTGALDTSFQPGLGANDTVLTLALLADGRVLIGGEFTTVDGHPRGHVALLNGDPANRPQFRPVAPPVGGVITLQVSTTPGQACVLETSTNLSNWTPVATNAAPGGVVSFTVTNAPTLGAGFYRVRLTP